MRSYLMGALAFMAAMLVFVLQNQQPVTVTFITWVSPEISLALVVLLAACAGAVITFLIDSFRELKALQRIREQRIQGRKKRKQEMDKVSETAGR